MTAQFQLTSHDQSMHRWLPHFVKTPRYITWFEGDHRRAAAEIEQRTHLATQANPWLLGRLIRTGRRIALAQDSSLQVLHYDPSRRTQLDFTMPFHQMFDEAARQAPPPRYNDPVFKTTVIPCAKAPERRFCTIVSLSHAIADGHTLGTILSCILNGQQPCVSLNVGLNQEQQIRLQSIHRRLAEITPGRFLNHTLTSGSSLIRRQLPGRRHVLRCRHLTVNAQYIEERKVRARESLHLTSGQNGPACSTNDILCSWFFQNCNTDLGIIPINLREVVDIFPDDSAGNLISWLILRSGEFSSPDTIRNRVEEVKSQIRSDSIPIPRPWQHPIFCKRAMVTNVSGFQQPIELSHCKAIFHTLLFPPHLWNQQPQAVISRGPSNEPQMMLYGTESMLDAMHPEDIGCDPLKAHAS